VRDTRIQNSEDKKRALPARRKNTLTLQGLNIPKIDPNVRHVGVSKLRKLNSDDLRKIEETLVLQENDTPLAVLVKYEKYLILQNELESLMATVELLTNKEETAALLAGLKDFEAGRTKPLSEIKASLGRKKRA
jgi:PHD/YefM family antitoxin component YafN of YafNO toxin-antitoxin module